MKTLLVFSCMAALVLSLNACNRNSVDPTTADGSARSSVIDSLAGKGPHSLTTVAVSALPATITSYISTNYAGSTIKEAKKGPEGNYWVAIMVDSKIKVLVFKADGTFVKELTAPEKPTSADSAHHPKPVHRDSTDHHKPAPGDSAHHPKPEKPTVGDTTHHAGPGMGAGLTEVAVSALPAAITSYINTNYPSATIDKAGQEKKTSDYVVLITTSAKKPVLLLFGSDGTFKKALTGK